MTREEVVDLARRAPLTRYLSDVRLSADRAEVSYDGHTLRWTVHFRRPPRAGGQRVFRAVVEDRTGRCVEQSILDNGRPAPTMAEALTLVRTSPRIGTWLTQYENTSLEPRYRVADRAWIVSVRLAGTRVGYARVVAGEIVEDDGPWEGTPPAPEENGEENGVRHPDGKVSDTIFRAAPPSAWMRLRSAVFFKHVAYALTVVFLVLVLDLRRPWTLRNLDALVLAAFVPAAMLVRAVPILGFGLPVFGGAYLMARLLYRTARPGAGAFSPNRYTVVLILVILAGLAWPAVTLRDVSLSQAARLACHGLAVAALIGLAWRVKRDWRQGLLLGTMYLLLSVATGTFAGGGLTAGLVAAGLWAWPSPYVSALCLGAATAVTGFPLLLVPLWVGAIRGRDRRQFASAFGAILVIVFVGLSLTGPVGPIDRLRRAANAVLWTGDAPPSPDTGFWGLFPSAAPVRLALLAAHLLLCVVLIRWPRRMTRFGLVAASAAVLAGAHLWLIGGGEHIARYLPIALIALFGAAVPPASSRLPGNDGATGCPQPVQGRTGCGQPVAPRGAKPPRFRKGRRQDAGDTGDAAAPAEEHAE